MVDCWHKCELTGQVVLAWFKSPSEFNPFLGLDSAFEGVFDHGHLGDQIGGGNQLFRGTLTPIA